MEDLTGACLSTSFPQEGQNSLMVALHSEMMDRFDEVEDSVTALQDNTDGPSDDTETIERLEEELDHEHMKVEDMRNAK